MFELRLDLVLMCLLFTVAPFFAVPFSVGAQASLPKDKAQGGDALMDVSTAAATVKTPATQDTAWVRVEESVRSEIARRWHIDPGQVVLEWGPHEGVGVVDSSIDPRLVGVGSAGEWVVRLEGTRGTVGVRVRAGSTQSVPLATTPMRRGQTLAPGDIRFDERTVWGEPDVAEASHGTDLVGWVTQRRINVGDRLVQPAVGPPSVVHTGESVEVAWATGAIRLTLIGRALGTARAGEVVSVRLETGKRVRGVALDDGTVRVSQNQRSRPEAASYLRPPPQLTLQSQPRL